MKNILSPLRVLLRYEFTSDISGNKAIGTSLLFALSTTFISFQLVDQQLHIQYWSALFWLIQLFNAFQLTHNHFAAEHPGSFLYHYTLYSPETFALQKIIYFSIHLTILALLSLLLWSFLGIAISSLLSWIGLIVIHSILLASVMSLISFLGAKLKGSFSFISILSLPILMPHLILLIKVTKSLLMNSPWAMYKTYLLSDGLLMMVCLTLTFILFPYLWNE